MIFEGGRLRLGPAGAVAGCGDGKGARRVLAGPRLWKADRSADLRLTDPCPPHLPMTHAPFSSAEPRKQIPFRNITLEEIERIRF